MFKALFSLFKKKKKSSPKDIPQSVSDTSQISKNEDVSLVQQDSISEVTLENDNEITPEEIYSQMSWKLLGLNPASGYIFQNITEGKRACFVNGTLYLASVDAHTATEIAEKFNNDPNENAKKFSPEVFFCLCKKAEEEQKEAVKKAVEEKEKEIESLLLKAKKEVWDELVNQNNSEGFAKASYPSITKGNSFVNTIPTEKKKMTESDMKRIEEQRSKLKEELDNQREDICGIKFYKESIFPFEKNIPFPEIEEFDKQKRDFLSRMTVVNTLPIEMESLQKIFNVFFDSFYFVGFKRFEARLKQIPEIFFSDDNKYTGSYKAFLCCIISLPLFAECIKNIHLTKQTSERFFGYEDYKKGNRTVLEIFSSQIEKTISVEDAFFLEKAFEGSQFCANMYSDIVLQIIANDENMKGKNIFSFFNEEKISEQLFNGLKML